MKRIGIAILAGGLLALAGCVHVEEHGRPQESKGGPPPWAPAHGYRQHQPALGPDLVFDAQIGVYVVVGYPEVYFHDGNYFRRAHSHWERCHDFEKARWTTISVADVPVPLAKHYAKKGRKPGPGHGPPPARHAD